MGVSRSRVRVVLFALPVLGIAAACGSSGNKGGAGNGFPGSSDAGASDATTLADTGTPPNLGVQDASTSRASIPTAAR
jgi:hypothetical protein